MAIVTAPASTVDATARPVMKLTTSSANKIAVVAATPNTTEPMSKRSGVGSFLRRKTAAAMMAITTTKTAVHTQNINHHKWPSCAACGPAGSSADCATVAGPITAPQKEEASTSSATASQLMIPPACPTC